MQRHDVDELARCVNLGCLPEPGKMSLIAGHQIVRARRVGTLHEFIIVGVFVTCSRRPTVTKCELFLTS